MCHCVPQNSHLCLHSYLIIRRTFPREPNKMPSHFQEENNIFQRAKNCPKCVQSPSRIGDDARQMNQSPTLEQRHVRSQVASCSAMWCRMYVSNDGGWGKSIRSSNWLRIFQMPIASRSSQLPNVPCCQS